MPGRGAQDIEAYGIEDHVMDSFFEITVVPAGGDVLVTPAGEIDMDVEAELDFVRTLLPPRAAVVLDMSGVPFMDVTGLHFFLDLHRHAEHNGTSLRSLGWQRQPVRLLELAAATSPTHWGDGPTSVRAALTARTEAARLPGVAHAENDAIRAAHAIRTALRSARG
ncbi:STAS domain-containing protein [Streptomyces sp. G-G2]|uniref:STAS domain-containing protein n=1 Tax=Streptomyces sp. G-G2 TaxID=3046201 RepID=UPI0024BB2552|nr:STAS domain-containing protein [Streptomyces sp. G-G2]MDJ0385610.1 STAS domain-containing protein [Streptomyces sp. G-G2]